MSRTHTAELVLDCVNAHGEGVVWSAEHGALMWTDIDGRRLWRLDVETGASAHFEMPERLCCFAPRKGRPDNQILAGFAGGFAFYDVLTGQREEISAFEPEIGTTRLNDGRTDRSGRFVAGGMDEGNPSRAISSVWSVDLNLTVRKIMDNVACANSICFSPDGATMYFADSPTGSISSFAYDTRTGTIGSRRLLAQTNGIPDGSCVDADGYIWNAVWEGYRVERYAPDGRLDRVVDVPVSKPTCCEFGGADLGTLFITTSRLGSSADLLQREPHAGGLFACRTGVRGLETKPFG